MELILVRHGIAESEVAAARSGRGDSERKLTQEGKVEAQKVAAALRQRILSVNRVLHSPYVRAEETAEIFAAEFRAPLELCEPLKPEDSPELAAEFLTQQEGRLMVVSHEPFLSGLLGVLLAGKKQIPTGFERAGVAGVEWEGAGTLLFFLPPRQLK